MAEAREDWPETERLIAVELDESLARAPSPDIEHERRVAVYDLLQDNRFTVPGRQPGPYRLKLSIADKRLIFHISNEAGEAVSIIGLSLTPFRRIVRDYFMLCESYFDAIRNATPSRIEPIDMARRGLHDEGTEILRERLAGKAEMDFTTARRLFTLVSVLYWRG